jgi:hypothetical protein
MLNGDGMKKIVLTGLMAIACSTSFAAEVPYEQSGNFWLAQCSPKSTSKNSNCAFFVHGLTKGAYGHAVITGSKELFCIPDGATTGQAVDVFYRYLVAHPESRHMDASALAFVAFRDAFPCNK